MRRGRNTRRFEKPDEKPNTKAEDSFIRSLCAVFFVLGVTVGCAAYYCYLWQSCDIKYVDVEVGEPNSARAKIQFYDGKQRVVERNVIADPGSTFVVPAYSSLENPELRFGDDDVAWVESFSATLLLPKAEVELWFSAHPKVKRVAEAIIYEQTLDEAVGSRVLESFALAVDTMHRKLICVHPTRADSNRIAEKQNALKQRQSLTRTRTFKMQLNLCRKKQGSMPQPHDMKSLELLNANVSLSQAKRLEVLPFKFSLAKSICVQLDQLPENFRLQKAEMLRAQCGGEKVDLHFSICLQANNVNDRFLELPWNEMCP